MIIAYNNNNNSNNNNNNNMKTFLFVLFKYLEGRKGKESTLGKRTMCTEENYRLKLTSVGNLISHRVNLGIYLGMEVITFRIFMSFVLIVLF